MKERREKVTEEKSKKRVLLDQLADLMNAHLDKAETDEQREEAIATGLETLLNFGLLSAFTAGMDEDDLHDIVHAVYDLYTEKKAND